MSTRATIHFTRGGETDAIIYRHGDGYPDGLGEDLKTFLNEVAKLPDNRFNDPAYLAAKWVVWDAAQMAKSHDEVVKSFGRESHGPLDFLSVGILMKDPGDIEYRWTVDCGKHDKTGKPTVSHEKV